MLRCITQFLGRFTTDPQSRQVRAFACRFRGRAATPVGARPGAGARGGDRTRNVRRFPDITTTHWELDMRRPETFYELIRRQGVSRRSFLKFCSLSAASLGLAPAFAPRIAHALE